MAKADTNLIILATSVYLLASGIRDLYDQNRGTSHRSTWFNSLLQMLLAFLLFAFTRT
jgi:hypothetical protein